MIELLLHALSAAFLLSSHAVGQNDNNSAISHWLRLYPLKNVSIIVMYKIMLSL